jgi:hypothetical protein
MTRLAGRFKAGVPPMPPRVFMCSEGPAGSGKSDFALTAPWPVGVIDIDQGLEAGPIQHVAERYPERSISELYVSSATATIPRGIDRANSEKLMPYYQQLYDQIVTDAWQAVEAGVRTLVIDGGSDLWEILRYAHFGRLEKVPGHLYVKANSEFRTFLNNLKSHCNVLVTHKVKDVWGEGPNGRQPVMVNGQVLTERAGFGEMANVEDVGISHRYVKPELDPDTHLVKKPGAFWVDITKCRQNPELVGTTWEGLDFQGLMAMVVPQYEWS